MSLKALLECDTWTTVILAATLGSIVLWFLILAVYSYLFPLLTAGADMRGVAGMLFSSPAFWTGLLFVPTTTLLADYVIRT